MLDSLDFNIEVARTDSQESLKMGHLHNSSLSKILDFLKSCFWTCSCVLYELGNILLFFYYLDKYIAFILLSSPVLLSLVSHSYLFKIRSHHKSCYWSSNTEIGKDWGLQGREGTINQPPFRLHYPAGDTICSTFIKWTPWMGTTINRTNS